MKNVENDAVNGKGKRKIAIVCVAVVSLCVVAFGCEEYVPSNNQFNEIPVEDITISDCKRESKSNDEDENEDESTVEVAYKGKYLYITHKDILLNCATLGVDVIVSVNESIIEVIITEKIPTGGMMATCLCPVDISYSVGEFEEGTYLLIIKPPYNKQYSQTVVF